MSTAESLSTDDIEDLRFWVSKRKTPPEWLSTSEQHRIHSFHRKMMREPALREELRRYVLATANDAPSETASSPRPSTAGLPSPAPSSLSRAEQLTTVEKLARVKAATYSQFASDREDEARAQRQAEQQNLVGRRDYTEHWAQLGQEQYREQNREPAVHSQQQQQRRPETPTTFKEALAMYQEADARWRGYMKLAAQAESALIAASIWMVQLKDRPAQQADDDDQELYESMRMLATCENNERFRAGTPLGGSPLQTLAPSASPWSTGARGAAAAQGPLLGGEMDQASRAATATPRSNAKGKERMLDMQSLEAELFR